MAVKLFRYTDKATGDECGVCYSGEDGSPAITNPLWDMVEIVESEKEFFIDKQKKQLADKPKPESDIEKLSKRIKALEDKTI